MSDENRFRRHIKIAEIIELLEEELGRTTGWSGQINGWEFNIRKKEKGYRIPILPIKVVGKEGDLNLKVDLKKYRKSKLNEEEKK